jgi:hypothetical protein
MKTKLNEDPKGRTVALDPNPKGELKKLGGSQADVWNLRLTNLVIGALPSDQSNSDTAKAASSAVCHAMVDIAPADPIEGILIAQLMAANEAALAMYRKGWSQPPEFFQARTKYLQLADKAARTVLMLTERLDHHRGRGQQQIVVKHVTVNADQAVVTDSITTGTAPALQNNSPVAVEQILEPELVRDGRGQKPK